MSAVETFTMPRYEVPAPPWVRRPFGLFSVSPPSPVTNVHALAGVWWRSQAGTGPVGFTESECFEYFDGEPGVAAEKIAAALCNLAGAWPFTVYALAAPSAGSTTESEVREQVVGLLEHGEEFGVEEALWDRLVATVTPTAAAGSLLEGLALLEAGARKVTGATPLLHVPAFAVSLLGDAVSPDGGRLLTRLGTPVVAGGGYASGEGWDAAPASIAMYATGPLVLLGDEVQSFPATVDQSINNVEALAERTFVLGWDGPTLGVTVTL